MKHLLTLLFASLLFLCTGAKATPTPNQKKVTLKTMPQKVYGSVARTPAICYIYALQSENSITFDIFTAKALVEIITDEMVVFTATVDADGSINLPKYLSGEYELRLYVGNDVYCGTVNL